VSTAVHSDRRWVLPAPVEVVWEAMASVDDYRRWWPWLRRFEAGALASGLVWHAEVRPPLRFPLRLEVAFTEVVAPVLVTAAVRGDVEGPARLELADHAEGCAVRLGSSLAPRSRSLRRLARLAPPVARWGHDQVLERGAGQFAERALPAARTTR
jgi:hypothetical protein